MDCAFDSGTTCGWQRDPRDTRAKWALSEFNPGTALCVDRIASARLRQRTKLSARLWSPTVGDKEEEENLEGTGSPGSEDFIDYDLDKYANPEIPVTPIQCLKFAYLIGGSQTAGIASETLPSLSILRHSTG